MNNFELLELSNLDEKSKQMIINTLQKLNESIIRAEIELFETESTG